MPQTGADGTAATPSETGKTSDKNETPPAITEVAASRQSALRTGAFAEAAAADLVVASKATTAGRSEGAAYYPAATGRFEPQTATSKGQSFEIYQDDITVGPQDDDTSPRHSPDTQSHRDHDLPASIDVVGSFEQSPGGHDADDPATPFQNLSTGDDDFAAAPDDDYQSPHLDDQMDVLGRTDLISSRFIPKTRHVDDVSPLGNDTASHFSRGSRNSATSWISRTSSMMSNLSVGSYRVQHPPMPLCCLQNVEALPLLTKKSGSQKRPKKHKASSKKTSKAVKKSKGRAKPSRPQQSS